MTRHRKNTPKGKKTVKDLKKEIFKLFKRSPKKRYHARQIIKKLKLPLSVDAVESRLQKMEKDGVLILLGNGKYKLNKSGGSEAQVVEGRVDMTLRGSAFIITDELEVDIHVPPKFLGYALHGDRVSVEFQLMKGRERPQGKVLQVLKRATAYFIGTLYLSKKFAFVIPDNERMPVDIFVPLDQIGAGKSGEKVLVKIVEWHGPSNKSPVGTVTTVLGKSGSTDIEMQSILLQQGFNLTFPEEVVAETKGFSTEIDPSEVEKRRDFREVLTFTIDPEDAKDFDDALSFRYLNDGHYEVGIHIADVTHFVRPGSELDKEALDRSTSVYLVDRVLPMLPEILSNQLCSLRPNEDKYCFSAVFVFDKDDQITERWFGKTLIHSDRRFTYAEAQEVLDTGQGDFASELQQLNRLAKKLRKARFKHGSISFISPEVRFRLDEAGKPTEVYIKEMKDSNQLIEDFMLLANREVAGFIANKVEGKPIPFVYRVHDFPDEVKIADFVLFAMEMGYKMKMDTPEQIASAFNQLTAAAESRPELKMLLPLAIRTMAKAVYTTDNIGHYGLGFENYAHFTSPIRRYADVLVHRLLEQNLETVFRTDKEQLEQECKHISNQERKALEAERESIKYFQVEFMESHIGEVFEGVVSGIIERGVFVELTENWTEGFVSFESIKEPFNMEGRYRAVGRRTGRIFKMGDPATVRIISVDRSKRKVMMELVEQSEIVELEAE